MEAFPSESIVNAGLNDKLVYNIKTNLYTKDENNDYKETDIHSYKKEVSLPTYIRNKYTKKLSDFSYDSSDYWFKVGVAGLEGSNTCMQANFPAAQLLEQYLEDRWYFELDYPREVDLLWHQQYNIIDKDKSFCLECGDPLIAYEHVIVDILKTHDYLNKKNLNKWLAKLPEKLAIEVCTKMDDELFNKVDKNHSFEEEVSGRRGGKSWGFFNNSF